MAEFLHYQTDMLFLLIGANPLPNYVAARLLAKCGATVYLLHSEEKKHSTYDIADRLKSRLADCRPDLTILLRSIPRADPRVINTRMETLLKDVPPAADVGLNYTGGTKPMAVHVYHVLRQAYPKGFFSYLDAATLTMVVNRAGERTQHIPVGRQVELDFETLFGLHDCKLERPRQEARHVEFCRTLVEVHTQSAGVKQWREWLNTFGDKDVDPQLPTTAEYPALEPVMRGFADLCEGLPTEMGVAQALGFDHLKSCAKFFLGGWLEEYTFAALVGLAEPLCFGDYGVALIPCKPGQDDFDIDVAAMWGYQLFAISCMVTEKKGAAKEHLFEVFVRARQVGGDEARFALVCCLKNTAKLQKELEEKWDAEGKIRVFGQAELLDLPVYLEDWFRTANREV